MNPYSCTSNTVKLFKHMDKLHDLQNRKVSPIMVHLAPTNACQLKCVHCCFANRDKDMHLEWSDFTGAVSQFVRLGVNAFEFTGGGDPLLWPHINRAVQYLNTWGAHVGLITNGIGIKNIEEWRLFDWVRVSLNTLEYTDSLNIEPLINKTDVTFCHIWHEGSKPHLSKVVELADKYAIPCRVTVDCTGNDIEGEIIRAKAELAEYDSPNIFLSDFNIDTETRETWDCRMHMIKPFLFADGYLYSCPSAELAQENNKMVHDGIRVCHYSKIQEFYQSYSASESKGRTCSYCKYAPQQRVLEQIFTQTSHNAFA